jgi:hypothetical protein
VVVVAVEGETGQCWTVGDRSGSAGILPEKKTCDGGKVGQIALDSRHERDFQRPRRCWLRWTRGKYSVMSLNVCAHGVWCPARC